ncbi:MAG TPA: DUF559 domain-containing protein [Kofleriaceae bacterium]|nr:DUF559 domain-containing protein [Kofleriaceae bacterium]
MGTEREHQEQQIVRRLVRDQWVRWHGTPRVTVLAGGAYAKRLWSSWLEVSGLAGALLDDGDVDALVRGAIARAVAAPREPIAITASPQALQAWRRGRTDRSAAMFDEGLLEIAEPPLESVPQTAHTFDARSAAEAALFDALEATPATSGRFRLNESLSIRFGSRAAEVDLLSRGDRIAIEVDGFHHFTDPDGYRRDRRKDVLLQTQGLLVIRVLAEDVLRDPREAVNFVCQALAYRLEEGAR